MATEGKFPCSLFIIISICLIFSQPILWIIGSPSFLFLTSIIVDSIFVFLIFAYHDQHALTMIDIIIFGTVLRLHALLTCITTHDYEQWLAPIYHGYIPVSIMDVSHFTINGSPFLSTIWLSVLGSSPMIYISLNNQNHLMNHQQSY